MIGKWLKDERLRLGFNQAEFAAIAGITRRPYTEWESGKTYPTAMHLALLGSVGADVQYIVTGTRAGQGFGESAVYQAVLDAVEFLSLEKKIDVQQLATAVVKICARNLEWSKLAIPPLAQNSTGVSGNIGRIGQQINAPVQGGVAGRDLVHKGRKKKNEAGDQQ